MNEKDPIGGYFELPLSFGQEYHKQALALNSGRSALEFILNLKKPERIWIPDYICDTVLQPINSSNIPYSIYSINEEFLPVNLSPSSQDLVLYVNYFGLCDRQVNFMENRYSIILDNTQAFFNPLGNQGKSFNSARKFFGVPDGGYVGIAPNENTPPFPIHSPENFNFLLQRLDGKTELGYSSFLANEQDLSQTGIKQMSTLSKKILQSINYAEVKERRRSNFDYLHNAFKEINQINHLLNLGEENVPFTYPLLIKNGSKLKKSLIENKIFIPTLWSEVLDKDHNSFAFHLANNTLFLPIDQRYDKLDMDRIINEITELGGYE